MKKTKKRESPNSGWVFVRIFLPVRACVCVCVTKARPDSRERVREKRRKKEADASVLAQN